MNPETTIVIAAYNEEERLPQTLKTIWGYLAKREVAAEVVVVDDGSTDNTAGVVRSISPGMQGLRLISYPRNKGKGFALRTGVLCSLGKKVLVTDADLSTPIEELEKLDAALQAGAGVAIASRAVKGSRVEIAQPIYRVLMGKVFNLIVQVVLLPGIWDTQCGFKLFRADVAKPVFAALTTDGFGYDPEVLYLAKRRGVKIAEVPVVWRHSAPTKVLPIRSSIDMFKHVVRVRFKR
jgi:dolichyl-phosphate beta-glucosyltransferase